MDTMKIGYYENPEAVGFIGWVEFGQKIGFVDLHGKMAIFDREASGAVIGQPVII